MRTKRKLFPRLMSVFTAFVLLLGMIPISALAAPAADIPASMLNNFPLEALTYTGYDVQWLKDSGRIYVKELGYAGYVPEERRSNIGYSGNLFGTCTVSDPSTPTGLAPDIRKFENYGIDCTAFGAYYYFNFLRNVKGKSIDELWGYFRYDQNNRPSPTGIYTARTVPLWKYGAEAAVAAGLGYKVGDKTEDLARATVGDLIIFQSTSTDELVHIGIYIGAYNETYFMAHVGNDRGPEIQSVQAMETGTGYKVSRPVGIYHFDPASYYEKGFIEVNKTDTNGTKLAGAMFKAVHQTKGTTVYIGPTDANGYAITTEELDLGTWVVTETTFPTGYGPYGPTSWTVNLEKDTPGGLVTINAVNQKGGTLYISKEVNTDNYMDKDGWQFQAVNNATGQVYGPFTTENDMGAYAELPVGTYTVTEINTGRKYWSYDTSQKQVTITSGGSASVEFYNKKGCEIKIVKTTNTGEGKAGHVFMAHKIYDSIGGYNPDEYIGPFVTDENGIASIGVEAAGTYEVYEVLPDGSYWECEYNNLRTLDITGAAGNSYDLYFENWQFGKVQVNKETNTGADKDGWEFEVTRKPDVNAAGTVLLQSPNRTYTKTNDGEAYLAT